MPDAEEHRYVIEMKSKEEVDEGGQKLTKRVQAWAYDYGQARRVAHRENPGWRVTHMSKQSAGTPPPHLGR